VNKEAARNVETVEKISDLKERIKELESFESRCRYLESKISEKEKQFEAVLNASFAGILLCHRDGSIFECNNAFARRFGRNKDAVIGENVWPLFPREVRGHRQVLLEKVFNEGKALYNEDERSGMHNNYVLYPVFAEDGSVESVVLYTEDITERKEARKYIEESERRYEELVQNAGCIILKWKRNGEITFLNEFGLSFFGFSEQDILGKSIMGTLVPYTEEKGRDLAALMEELFEHPERYERNVNQNICRDGRRVWVSWTNKAVFDDQGQAFEMFSIGQDITDRKRAEKELRENERILRSLFEATPVGVALLKDRIFLKVNTALCRITGYSEKEMGGMQTRILYPNEEEFLHVGRVLYEQMDREGLAVMEATLRRKDGTIIVVILSLSPFDPADLSAGVCATVMDITERRKTEEELRRLSIAIEQADEDIVITDREGVIQYVNPAFEKITGFSRTEAIGQNPRILKSGVHGPEFYEYLWSTIKSGNVWKGRITNRCKDGRLIQEEATISPLLASAGKLTGYVALKRDVTETIRLETLLRQGQKMEAIGTLAGGIAHDFNNILGSIIGYSELANMTIKDDEIKRYLEQVLKASNRAKALVAQILTFSRQSIQEKKPLFVTPIFKEVIKLLRSSLPANIQIRQNFTCPYDTVYADSTQIYQVLMNLCTNAAHAMRENGGLLDITLETENIPNHGMDYAHDLNEGAYLKLVVKDTGCGIDPSILEHVFEPFFTTKREGEGTGLGLSVVYGIVKDHGGSIHVSSQTGKGTAFTILLPLIEEMEADLGETETQIPRGRGSVLLVDDEEALAQMGEKMLTTLGYDVSLRYSSLDALEAFRKNPQRYDLVITDMTMPHMSGANLAREMIKIRSDIPIILVSGFSEQIDGESAKKIGFRDFLMKPVSFPNLAQAVKRILDQETSTVAR